MRPPSILFFVKGVNILFSGVSCTGKPMAAESLINGLKFTVSNIKNIALQSAFMAAGDGGVVKMKHIVLATKREFQKIGRLCIEKDFKKYYELVSDEGRHASFEGT